MDAVPFSKFACKVVHKFKTIHTYLYFVIDKITNHRRQNCLVDYDQILHSSSFNYSSIRKTRTAISAPDFVIEDIMKFQNIQRISFNDLNQTWLFKIDMVRTKTHKPNEASGHLFMWICENIDFFHE